MVSEIRKNRKNPSNPIRSIDFSSCNNARDIVIQIASVLGFKIVEDNKGVYAYGGNNIRIADHRTYMQTWVDNETWNAPIRLDIVIEDSPTIAQTQVKNGYDFSVTEIVYNSSDIDPSKARIIAYDIRNVLNGNGYANNVRGEKHLLQSTSTSQNNLNCNVNMCQKHLIK